MKDNYYQDTYLAVLNALLKFDEMKTEKEQEKARKIAEQQLEVQKMMIEDRRNYSLAVSSLPKKKWWVL